MSGSAPRVLKSQERPLKSEIWSGLEEKWKQKQKADIQLKFGTFFRDSTKPFIGTTFSRQGGERKRGDKCSHFLLWCKQSFVSVTRGNLRSDSDVMVNWPITGRDLPLIVMHCFVTVPQLPSVQCRRCRSITWMRGRTNNFGDPGKPRTSLATIAKTVIPTLKHLKSWLSCVMTFLSLNLFLNCSSFTGSMIVSITTWPLHYVNISKMIFHALYLTYLLYLRIPNFFFSKTEPST